MFNDILFYLNIIILVAGVVYISYGIITEKPAQRGSFYENQFGIILLVMVPALSISMFDIKYYMITLAGVLFVMACIIYSIILKMKQHNMRNMKRDLFWLAFIAVTILVILFFAWW